MSINDKIKKNSNTLFILLVSLSIMLSFPISIAQQEDVVWEATLIFTAGSLNNDASNFCIFGESMNASNGPPADNLDAPKSPTPPSPYVDAFFNDNLAFPTNKLTSDYRHYCDDVDKQWNLTMSWDLITYPETINVTWEISDLSQSPYANIYLRDNNGDIVSDMFAVSLFQLPVTADGSTTFTITCENVSCESGDDSGDPLGDDDDRPLGDDDDPSNGDDNPPGNGGPTDPSPGNQPPIAQITMDNTTGLIGSTFSFSGYGSSDDGSIQSYEWDLGNGQHKTGINITYSYENEGSYTVVLTVTDDQGETDSDSIVVQIVTGNLPPQVSIQGLSTGSQDQEYEFTLKAIDANEDDLIRFHVDWGDGSTAFLSAFTMNTTMNITHSFDSYGLFTLSVYAEDNASAQSDTEHFIFAVDAMSVDGDLTGYLFDEDSDGVYDGFFFEKENRMVSVTSINDSVYQFEEEAVTYSIDTIAAEIHAQSNNEIPTKENDETESFNAIPFMLGFLILMIIALIIFIIKYA